MQRGEIPTSQARWDQFPEAGEVRPPGVQLYVQVDIRPLCSKVLATESGEHETVKCDSINF